jgi:hypothetical protein
LKYVRSIQQLQCHAHVLSLVRQTDIVFTFTRYSKHSKQDDVQDLNVFILFERDIIPCHAY